MNKSRKMPNWLDDAYPGSGFSMYLRPECQHFDAELGPFLSC